MAILAVASHAQPPDAKETIARMQAAALAYTDRLHDFTCTQELTRRAGSSPAGSHWKLLDTQEAQLDYVNRREHYKLLKVNGQSTDPQKHIKSGYFIPGGEFGSLLEKIFDPKAQAEFAWDHDETAPGSHTCVFRYDVPQATTTYGITADQDRVRLGHHGMVWADCETGSVTHFQIETDLGEIMRSGRHVALGSRTEVRYAPVKIGGQEFLLPQSAEVAALFYKTWTKYEIRFEQYRKYDANSTIKFGDGGDGKD
jgi:hypothetical protein